MYIETHYENPGHTRLGGTRSNGRGEFSGVTESDHPEQWAEILANSPPADWVDPRTAEQIWQEEATRLDKELVSLGSLARTIEDLATTGVVSDARKLKLAGAIAARVAHRLVKPA